MDEATKFIFMTAEGKGLVWQQWDEFYIVYQPSSTETHVLNETSALILISLEKIPLSSNGVMAWILENFGFENDELVQEDFDFAISRLVELGLINWIN